ncbi:MAG: hypothetical protein ACXW0T_04585 [Methylobacter sp.]
MDKVFQKGDFCGFSLILIVHSTMLLFLFPYQILLAEATEKTLDDYVVVYNIGQEAMAKMTSAYPMPHQSSCQGRQMTWCGKARASLVF